MTASTEQRFTQPLSAVSTTASISTPPTVTRQTALLGVNVTVPMAAMSYKTPSYFIISISPQLSERVSLYQGVNLFSLEFNAHVKPKDLSDGIVPQLLFAMTIFQGISTVAGPFSMVISLSVKLYRFTSLIDLSEFFLSVMRWNGRGLNGFCGSFSVFSAPCGTQMLICSRASLCR